MKGSDIICIPAARYEGYIWMSDASAPIVIDGEMDALELDPMVNPFVIEAQLYDRANRISYSVRYTDGCYHTPTYNLNEIENDPQAVKSRKMYLANRMDGIEYLNFIRIWRPGKDPLCDGMDVLMPAERIFEGFKRKETIS